MTIEQQLAEARNALHALVLGKKAVRLQKEGRMVEYTPTNRRDLEAYISALESRVDKKNLRRPIGVRL